MHRPENQPHNPERQPVRLNDDSMSYGELIAALLCCTAFGVTLLVLALLIFRTLGLFELPLTAP
jgi:hypothetical protein